MDSLKLSISMKSKLSNALDLFFDEPSFNWYKSDNIHLGNRYLHKELTKRENATFQKMDDIDCMDNVFGELARYIFYQDYHLCGVNYFHESIVYGQNVFRK